MQCEKCTNAIECRLSIQTELEDRPIYINYQWWQCKSCGEKYYAILEDSRINIFDDTLEHTGYFADEENWTKTLQWALQCTDPGNAMCKCVIHQQIPPSDFFGESAWYTHE